MEERIEKLEDYAADAKERLVRIEARVDSIDERLATNIMTKAHLAEAKLAVIGATISTMVALVGIVFAIARYFPST